MTGPRDRDVLIPFRVEFLFHSRFVDPDSGFVDPCFRFVPRDASLHASMCVRIQAPTLEDCVCIGVEACDLTHLLASLDGKLPRHSFFAVCILS